jgi:hypothetical protein
LILGVVGGAAHCCHEHEGPTRIRSSVAAGHSPTLNRDIATSGDVLVNQTADGVSLDTLWQEVIDLFGIVNSERLSLVNLMTYWHTQTGDAVPQALNQPNF